MAQKNWRWLFCSIPVALLVACGGGGGGGGDIDGDGDGGGSTATTREALPELVTQTLPAGDRLDMRARDYFPAAMGDSWTYDRLDAIGAGTVNAVTRSVTSEEADAFTITETQQGLEVETETLRRTSEGVVLLDPAGSDAPAAARNLIGSLLLYPEPFYPVGGTRTVVRQGNWGEDVDGDGITDSFRLEMTQQLVGFEAVTPPLGTFETAHFRTVIALTLSPSSLQHPVITATATEDSWWAPAVGMVRAERTITDGIGMNSSYSLALSSASVGGYALPVRTPDGAARKLALRHNALVFDATRNRYYATIPASVAGSGNRIAVIDASSGAVSYSEPVGSEPFALAVAPDGSALYVGLNGSGEIVKLSLPSMAAAYHVRLPIEPNFNSQLLARGIAVSPVEGDVLAVTLRNPGPSGNYPGVIQIRAAALQPQQVQFSPLYSMDPITYDGSGAMVYAYGNNFGDATLFALAVRSDGLVVTNQSANTTGHGIRDVDWSRHGIVASRGIYRSSDLSLLTVVAPYACRAQPVNSRFICIGTDTGTLAVLDALTFGVLATPAYSPSPAVAPGQLVPGPAGQVALRFGTAGDSLPADEVWLFDSPSLR